MNTTTPPSISTSGAPMRVARYLHETYDTDGTAETLVVDLDEIGGHLDYEPGTVLRALKSLQTAGALTVTKLNPFVPADDQPARTITITESLVWDAAAAISALYGRVTA